MVTSFSYIACQGVGIIAAERANRTVVVTGGAVIDTIKANQAVKLTTRFAVEADSTNVVIRVDGYEPHAKYWEFRSDGITSQFIERFADNFTVSNIVKLQRGLTETRSVPPKRPDNQVTVKMEATVTPTIVGSITPVWLTYSPTAYLRHREPGNIELDEMFLYLGPAIRNGITERAQWKWEGEERRFLREFTSKITTNGKNDVSSSEKPNADFLVTAWTNVSGITIPLSSSLTVYDPGDPSLVLKCVKILADSIVVQQKFSAPAIATNVGAPAYIVDRRVGPRFADEPVRYNSKSGEIKPIELIEEFRSEDLQLRK